MRRPCIVHKEIYRAIAPTESKRREEVELRRPLLTGVAILLRACAAAARSAAMSCRAFACRAFVAAIRSPAPPRNGPPLDFLLELDLAGPLACARSCDWARRDPDAARSCDWAHNRGGVAIWWYTGPLATGGPSGTGRGGGEGGRADELRILCDLFAPSHSVEFALSGRL